MTHPSVPARPLGPGGPAVPALSLGSWGTWNRTPFDELVATVRRAAELGAAWFDAALYRAAPGGQDSPTDVLLSRAIQLAGLRRDDYLLSVKGWLQHPDVSIGATVRETLWRHGSGHADFLVVGDVMDEGRFDADDMVGQVAELLRAGVVRAWAVNNWSVPQIVAVADAAARAGIAGPAFAQLKYGITRRAVAEGEPFAELIARTGIAIQASSVFDGGVLLGAGTERMVAGDIGGIHPAVHAARERIAGAAAELGASLAQLALAYPLTNPATANALVGVRNRRQLDELVGAFALLERVGAPAIEAACAPFCFDRGRVDPLSSWAHAPHATPSYY